MFETSYAAVFYGRIIGIELDTGDGVSADCDPHNDQCMYLTNHYDGIHRFFIIDDRG